MEAPVVALYNVGSFELARNYGVVEVDSGLRVFSFEEKPVNPKEGIVSTGIYAYPRKAISMMQRYFEEGGGVDRLGDFVQRLHRRIPVYEYVVKGEWWDIGTRETYYEALRELNKNP